MIVTNGLIVYAWVQAYILENDNFVLMGLLWAIYIARDKYGPLRTVVNTLAMCKGVMENPL
jgi:hypothetical protein